MCKHRFSTRHRPGTRALSLLDSLCSIPFIPLETRLEYKEITAEWPIATILPESSLDTSKPCVNLQMP